MKKKLLPLAMLAGLAGVAGHCVGIVLDVVSRVLLGIADIEPVEFEAELAQAGQGLCWRSTKKPESAPYGTAQAREFVTMLRGIGSGSGEMAAA